MSQIQNILILNLGNPILGKIIDEFIQRVDDNIAHVENLIKSNVQVRYPALFKFIQSLVFFL